MDKKYLLNSFAVFWWLLTEAPSIFKVLTLSVIPVFLVSDLTVSQTVLFLFKVLLILLALFSFFASLMIVD
jgi:hypothetical protein